VYIRERGTVLSRELVVKRIKFDFAAAVTTTTTTQYSVVLQHCRYLRRRFWSVVAEKRVEIETRGGDETRESLYYYYIYVCI